MKNILKIVSVGVVCGAFLSGCGGDSPEEIALKFTKGLNSGDAKVINEFCDLPKEFKPGEKEMLDGKMAMAIAQVSAKNAQKGGVKDFKIAKSDMDKESGLVRVDKIFNDGTTDYENVKLVLVDNKWKINCFK
ncbi:MAG: DUF4878 domain-containing protein [Helicobacter sp.]|nr:DUF4878 domain-containing protein [Helicobacteraceae bacterium]MDY3112951.1 DUF4878 domain-containing protein [Helicobacter sp.]